MLDIADFMQTVDGKGVVNILAADKLMNAPRLYATFLLWMLSELFEMLPEVGDLEKPKLVFFFDEAHLLFKDAPAALVERIELVVRLVRSKGVGVYFVTQNPLDVPDTVLAQLGNRVQHALRAFTPRDQKAVKAAAETMRANPKIGDMRPPSPSWRWARRWSASSTPRAAPASPSASTCCRRAARSAPSRRRSARR
jgi:DNA helicase HerA-like ATPase